jgi:cation:H+ antiporter
MLLSLGLVAIGLALLVAGGETLLRGAVGLATLCRLTPAVIGLTVVAAGTSVPELAVSGVAASRGETDIAIANVVGSNIFNIAFIIGLCALVRPMPIVGNTLRLEYPVLVVATVLCLLVGHDGVIDRWEGGLLLGLYVVFNVYVVRLVRRQATVKEAADLSAEVKELEPAPRPDLRVSIAFLVGGIVLLGAGAHSTVVGAVGIATLLGLSERVIGLTIVSAGTGLPEVVASLVSSIRGRSDIAAGNVIGSNLFNILVILGLTSLIAPLAVPHAIADNDSWWMLAVTLLLLPIMFSGCRISRWEGGLLLGVYAFYIGLLLNQSS